MAGISRQSIITDIVWSVLKTSTPANYQNKMKPVTIFFLSVFLYACSDTPLIEQIKKDGKLVVATRNSPTTYYLGPDGAAGFEYDLASMFAKELGVELEIKLPDSLTDIFSSITSGNAHIASAGLTVTEKRKQLVKFGPVYQTIQEQVVYHKDNNKPKNINELGLGLLEIVSGSSHAEHLENIKKDFDKLTWHENQELGSEELLSLVWEQVIDYTIADSNEVDLNKRFYPELEVAFSISEPQSLAWAFPKSTDQSLYDAATAFFKKIKSNGELNNIINRYYGNIDVMNRASRRSFSIHFNKRLPRYRKIFEQAALEYNLDWRLLAAIGYQESHWNPKAKSPTGVRGIMMLTLDTAKFLGIKNRNNAEESINGGAKYIVQLQKSIPEHIPEPERTWFALASYNIGRGHVEDARNITAKRGMNPDKWLQVKESLPLLRKKKWYKKTKYGYARGNETLRYVENVRNYYDYLIWLTDQEENDEPAPNKAIDIKSLAL